MSAASFVTQPTTMVEGTKRRRSALLADATKGAVCVAAGVTCLYVGARAGVVLVGSLTNAATVKILKYTINLPRPDGSTKRDPGMPSSHAASLFYLARAASRPLPLLGSVGLVLGAAIACAWRIRCGYHTFAQVFVGASLGLTVEALWNSFVVPDAMRFIGEMSSASGGYGKMTEMIVVVTVLAVGAAAMFGREALTILKKLLGRSTEEERKET